MTFREFAEIYKERHAIAKKLSLAQTIDWRIAAAKLESGLTFEPPAPEPAADAARGARESTPLPIVRAADAQKR